MKRIIKISPRAWLIFGGAFVGLLLSKGLALAPGFALDDYVALHLDRNLSFYLSQGRYTQAGIQFLLTQLGVTPTAISWSIVLLFFIAASTAITNGFLFASRRRGSAVIQAASAALVGAYPYLTEYFTFRESLITQGTSFALLAFVFFIILEFEKSPHPRRPFVTGVLISIVMLALAGTQQTVFLIACFILLTRLTMDALLVDGESGLRSALRANSMWLATFLISAGLYALIFLLSRKLGGGSLDQRSSVLSPGDAVPRLHQIGALLKKIFLLGEPILSSTTKVALLTTTLGLILAVSAIRLRAAIACLGLFLVLSFGSIFLVSVSATWWPVPRAIYGIAFSFGLTIVAAAYWLAERWRKPFAALLVGVAIMLIFHSNAILHDQLRLNRWDIWTAGAIAHDLASRNVNPEQKILLVGAPWQYSVGPKTSEGDMNVSALSVPWAARYLLKEATGRDWNVEVAQGRSGDCAHKRPWPSPESIQIHTEEVIVCMAPR